ncbi:protein FAM184A isoform X2 [Corvus cornix cornix]|uniref:Family with sequence similarity 184 member A n=1 Tax=Corvus moneduloides TaxID=1196302 RepID=A0A8C3D8I5_CORMO|nr:protein FAM184A isoform X2 [Corvus moneduloides]XP_039425045.1 protein FAM184A isoform X2 [Corvus cornix cornix]
MATPGMGWQQPQHGYGGGSAPGAGKLGSGSAQAGLGAEHSPDLHFKMSKKIAQLTKVIYALNTKNDEHEAAIQALKEAHEEEIQQILAETREKILQYKNKVAEEMDLKRKIQVLEESLEDHKKMKHQALTEFEAYKDRVEDMQLCAEAQHVQRVVTMSREVEEIRKKFEERLRSFIQLQVQYEKDKRTALEDLKAAHRLEIQELLKTHQSQNATLSKGQEKLEELHRLELEDLNSKVEELRLERKKLIEDYEGKLSKAQSFYEHELDSLKRSQLFTAESLHACKEKEVELRKEFQNQESMLRKNLGKLKTELQMVQDEAASLREKCQKLQVALGTAENNVQVLQKQLDDVKEEEMSLLSKHKEVESELAAARERLQQQATDLVLKASHIGMLQATQMTQEVTIRDLESEKSRLKEKLSQLEEERNLLQSKTQSLDERQRQQILALEKKVNEARETQREYYEKELVKLQARLEGEAAQLKEAHSKTLEELAWKHHTAIEAAHSNANKDKKKLQMELEQQFEKEKLHLEDDKNQLRQQLENMKEDLTTKLTSANQEVCRLQDLVRKSEQGLGTAEGHISSLQEAQEILQKELELTRARLRETTDSLYSVEGELDQERQQHEAMIAAMREEEKFKVDRMARDLEIKWTENLRQECNKLREELRLQHEEDKKAAMTQLLQLKEREKNAARDGWQKKVEDLLDQISLLKQNLEMQLSQSQSSLQQLQAQFSQERQRLTQEIQELEEEHQQRHKSLQEAHILAFQNMEETKEQEQKELEERLQQKHSEELHALKETHKQAMEGFKLEMEQELQTLRFELEDEGKAMLASLRSELNHQHAAAIDQLRHNHQQELVAAKMELERSIELGRRQEKEFLCRISDLQDELRHRDHHIAELDKEILHLHENISALTKELEFKGKEILRIHSESNQQIRMHEQDLSKKHEKELDVLTADHIREKQSMLADFNKTQELLKEINSALQISLEEMEEKYKNRESRPEDLQLISELKDLIAERDQLIKKLIEDKKFYQLELVNRETNYNKMFNASPNVGVINPLVKQKKKNDKATNRFVSVPNLSALESSGVVGNGHPNRLDPIPNSPIHDIEFNSSKPLPQPMPPKEPKTFLSPPQTDASPVASPDPQRQEWFARYFTF